jgi:hypothetical protein
LVLEHGERIVIEQINVWPAVSTMTGVLEVLVALALAGLGIGGVLLIERIAGRDQLGQVVKGPGSQVAS